MLRRRNWSGRWGCDTSISIEREDPSLWETFDQSSALTLELITSSTKGECEAGHRNR